MINVSTMDLRKYPFFLTDGDIIGMRIESDGMEDDFQCAEDIVKKAEFVEAQRLKKEEQDALKRLKNSKNAADEASIYINLD